MLHQENQGLFHLPNHRVTIDIVAEICSRCEYEGNPCPYETREEHCNQLRNEMRKKMYIWDLNRGWVKLSTPSPSHDTLISGRGY